jgi:transcriptional regulator with XRE-family HTH domain
MKNINEWIKSLRNNQRLDSQVLFLSGIDRSQISRLENGKRQATLSNVVSLCYGLNLALSDLITELDIDIKAHSFHPNITGSILNINDVNGFSIYYQSNKREALNFLKQYYYYSIIRSDPDKLIPSSKMHRPEDDVEKVDLSIISSEHQIPYPNKFSNEHVRDIFINEGVLTYKDVGFYILNNRIQKGLSIRECENASGINRNTINQLERGLSQRILFQDIISLDNSLALSGELLAMYWKAEEFHTGILRNKALNSLNIPPMNWQKNELNLINTLIIISRWMQVYYSQQYEAWLNKIREFYRPLIKTNTNQDSYSFLQGDLDNPFIKLQILDYFQMAIKPHISFITLPEELREPFKPTIPTSIQKISSLIFEHSKTDSTLQEILNDLSNIPGDEDGLAAYKWKVKKMLFEDVSFAKKIQSLLLEYHQKDERNTFDL